MGNCLIAQLLQSQRASRLHGRVSLKAALELWHFCGLESCHLRHLIGPGSPRGYSGRHSSTACALLCCSSPRGCSLWLPYPDAQANLSRGSASDWHQCTVLALVEQLNNNTVVASAGKEGSGDQLVERQLCHIRRIYARGATAERQAALFLRPLRRSDREHTTVPTEDVNLSFVVREFHLRVRAAPGNTDLLTRIFPPF